LRTPSQHFRTPSQKKKKITCVSIKLTLNWMASGVGPSGLQICKPDETYPIYKFANRMDPSHCHPVYKLTQHLHIGWMGIRFVNCTSDATSPFHIRFTIYKLDDLPSSL